MNKSVFITLAMLALAAFQPIRAQGRLQGVVSSQDGHPVEYASVGVTSTKVPVGAVTDSRGRYQFNVSSSDSITMRVSCTGFVPQELRTLVRKGETRVLNIVLQPSSTQLDEVVVSDESIRTTTFTEIDIQRIENTVGPSDGVEALIKTLPDVTSNNELSSQYSVRGGSFDENLVYINGVEVFRPQLVRSGQQEGLSIVNPDLVDHLLFSPGGFDCTYGDRMSSVLDILYSRPIERKYRASLSLLGGSLSAQGRAGERFSYSVGFRHRNNSYLFRSLDTEGQYTSSYTDLQGIFGYRVNDKLDLSLLTVWTRNRYGLVPFSSTTTFGSFYEYLELEVYFDGLERDRYNTLLGAFTLDFHPSDDFQLSWTTSAQRNNEEECYDIQSQYRLYQVGVGENTEDTNRFDRGVGTFLEHARNSLDMRVYASELKAVRYAALGSWALGVKAQYEDVRDRVREWKLVDSAGYSFPTQHVLPGVADSLVFNPVVQLFCTADNHIRTLRGVAYAQREVNLFTRRDDEIKILAGFRLQGYNTAFPTEERFGQMLFSPRLAVNFKPKGKQDLLYRLAAGVYQQPYLYREIRRLDGSLATALPAQCSYQAMGTVDWNLRIGSLPFRLTADIYYKYITHLVPYTIDNLRVRYNPDQEAVGYAAGVSLRVNGDFVKGLESWASVSFMKTQEDILGDGLGWLSRPTDQRLSFKVFLQDYVPTIPWWRMSLSLCYGTGTPVTHPYQTDRSTEFRLPSYFRVDWGNAVQLTRFEKVRQSRLGQFFNDISVGVEVFNLFDYHNVVSFLWVADYSNQYYPVPNYLTARQVNFKITATF